MQNLRILLFILSVVLYPQVTQAADVAPLITALPKLQVKLEELKTALKKAPEKEDKEAKRKAADTQRGKEAGKKHGAEHGKILGKKQDYSAMSSESPEFQAGYQTEYDLAFAPARKAKEEEERKAAETKRGKEAGKKHGAEHGKILGKKQDYSAMNSESSEFQAGYQTEYDLAFAPARKAKEEEERKAAETKRGKEAGKKHGAEHGKILGKKQDYSAMSSESPEFQAGYQTEYDLAFAPARKAKEEEERKAAAKKPGVPPKLPSTPPPALPLQTTVDEKLITALATATAAQKNKAWATAVLADAKTKFETFTGQNKNNATNLKKLLKDIKEKLTDTTNPNEVALLAAIKKGEALLAGTGTVPNVSKWDKVIP